MAGIYLTKFGWQVRWQQGGKQKSKRFKVEAEAYAFKKEKDTLKEETKKRKWDAKREERADKRRKGVEKSGNNSLVETRGIKLLSKYIGGLTRVTDGAHADLFLPIANDVQQRGYGIQVKVCTTRKDGAAHFYKVNHYEDLIIICVLLDEKRVWVFDGKTLTHFKSDFGIGRKSKYNNKEVQLDQLEAKLETMVTEYTPNTLDYFNTQLSPKYLAEYIVHEKWLKATGAILEQKGIDHVENSVVDCIQIINDDQQVTRQEKVMCKHQNAFYANLKKNAGKVDGKYTFQPYEKGDNNVYCFFVNKYTLSNGDSWTHRDDRKAILSATLIGWFEFPEEILIQRGYIETESRAGSTSISCYLPENVAISVGIPVPKLKCKSLWTRDYFHSLLKKVN